MSEIRGKTVLVTGGASGIGYLMGRMLLEEGAGRLVIWDIQEEATRQVVQELEARGHRVDGFRVNVAELAEVQRAVTDLHERSIEIDVLINNAGIVVGKDFAEHSAEDIARTMGVNALGPMYITRELLPGMLQRGTGHIVNISSVAGMAGNPRMSVYCASKWALAGWSDSLRIELEQAGGAVKVTTVMPYYIDTGMFAGVTSPVVPILKPERVAREIVQAIKKDRLLLALPSIAYLVPIVRSLLPTRWFDKVGGDWLGAYHSMKEFRGRA